ncbi:MAG: hydroxyethylthiazole kinase [Candidatus Nealsonbacteria bacterium]|nr:MAG: hydroxyethylthiazole kinase [Candidatus Nealsonbacteria bacterium]
MNRKTGISKINLGEKIFGIIERIRQERPLIHNITNMVAMNDSANIILAIGGLPVMAHAQAEVREMVRVAGALVLNIGTLTSEQIDSMIVAGEEANNLKKPVVLDPVGAGATHLRTESALRLQERIKIDIVRGNHAEVSILAGLKGSIKGVESVGSGKNAVEIGQSLARRHNQVVIITGKKDIVTDGKTVIEINNGSPMLGTITATGCMVTSLIATFAAVWDDYIMASTGALVCFGLAGEKAAVKAQGPGSFKVNLFDEVYNLNEEIICKGLKVNIYEL